jgi:hypothetical protein
VISETVYVLCMLTSLFCAVLLLRSYRHARSRLLLWSVLCFVGLAIANALLVLDLIVFVEQVDLRVLRGAVGLIAGFAVVGGLIWELR